MTSFMGAAFGDCGCSLTRAPGLGAAPDGGYRDPATVRAVQQALQALARTATDERRQTLDPGTVDGAYGPKTADAVAQLQILGNQAVTGEIDDYVIAVLGVTMSAGAAGASTSTGATARPSAPPTPSSSKAGWLLALGAVALGAVALKKRKRAPPVQSRRR